MLPHRRTPAEWRTQPRASEYAPVPFEDFGAEGKQQFKERAVHSASGQWLRSPFEGRACSRLLVPLVPRADPGQVCGATWGTGICALSATLLMAPPEAGPSRWLKVHASLPTRTPHPRPGLNGAVHSSGGRNGTPS